jgi:uncharacterized protein (UPF0335 family)
VSRKTEEDDLEDVLGTAGLEGGDNSSTAAAQELRQIIERIEHLEEEKKGIADDIKEFYAEAKGKGYDTKILRKVIAIRKKPKDERDEEEAILEMYLTALGMI